MEPKPSSNPDRVDNSFADNGGAASTGTPVEGRQSSTRGGGGPGIGPNPALLIQDAGAADPELSFADLRRRLQAGLGMVRRRWWAGVLAAALLAGPLGYVLISRPVEYEAQTTVLVQSALDEILSKSQARDTTDAENLLKNHISVMTSRGFRARLAASFSPEDAENIQRPYLEPGDESSFERLAGMIGGLVKVDRERGRELFTITATHQDKDVALMLAGQFSAEYRRLVQEGIQEVRGIAATILRKQADELSDEIKRLSDDRREYRKTYNLITIEENQGILAERLRRINLAVADVRVERVRLETQIQRASEDLGKGVTPYDNPVLSSFGNIQVMRIELDRLRNEYEGLATQLGPNHPTMKESKRNLAMLEATMEKSFQLAYADLQGRLELARSSEKQLGDELTLAFNQSLELDKQAAGFKRLTDEIAAKEQSLTALLQQIEQTDREAQRPVEAMRVVDAPYLTRSGALQKVYIMVGLSFLALFAFVATPVGLYLWSERLSGSMDLEAAFRKEVLGVLPRMGRTKPEDRPHVVRDNVDLARVEEFLSLAAQFDLSSKISYPKRLLVTSAVPGEGKSMIASNLAATFTRYGRKSLLIDADFRRPVQHHIHQIEHEDGFLGWASHGYPLTKDIFKMGGVLGLSVLPDGTTLLPAGGVDQQPGHILVARPVAELLRRLSEVFEVIIVDSPPAGVFQDALILARYCDETIVVVREGRAHITQMRKMLADLDRTRAPALGLVLNASSLRDVHPSLGSRYGYGKYGYGKSGYDGRYRYKAVVASRAQADKPSPKGGG